MLLSTLVLVDKAGKGGTVDFYLELERKTSCILHRREGRGSCTLHGKERWGSRIFGSKRRQLRSHGGRGGAVATFMRGTGRAVALFKEEGRDICLLCGFALLWIENAYRRPGVCSSTEEMEKSLSMPSSS